MAVDLVQTCKRVHNLSEQLTACQQETGEGESYKKIPGIAWSREKEGRAECSRKREDGASRELKRSSVAFWHEAWRVARAEQITSRCIDRRVRYGID